VLGFYYSGHPLSKWELEIRSFATTRTSEVAELRDGTRVVLGGLVTKVRRALDRRGNRIAFVELEDFTGALEALVFAEPLKEYGAFLTPDAMVLVGGTLSVREEAEPKLRLDRAIPLAQVAESIVDRIVVDVADPDIDEGFVARLGEFARRHPGRLRVLLRVTLRDGRVAPVDLRNLQLSADRVTLRELGELVGEGRVCLGGTWRPGRPEASRGRSREASAPEVSEEVPF
jgi:DNA polymerase-3 subunit alpha